MSPHVYGSLEPIYFKLVKAGVNVLGRTLLAADVVLMKDGGAGANIGSECAEVGLGFYKWTPSVSTQTQCKKMQIAIQDSTGSLFDDNGIQVYTGGDPSAFLGTP